MKFRLTSNTHSRHLANRCVWHWHPPCESGTHHMKRIETRKESAEAKIRQQALSAALGPGDRRRLSATARDFRRDSQPDLVPGSASDFARRM
jgi:hypothetical protein